MPILIPHEPGASLRQGDVLRDIHLAVSDATGDDGCQMHPPSYVLVLSRNCNALRDREVVVARVIKRSLSSDRLSELSGLEDWRQYFDGLRDGKLSPDNFYLGEFEANSNDRFVAKLDSLHTVRLPESRQPFVDAHRMFRLHIDFIRELHARIVGAFSPLGFDDHDWFSNADLKLLVTQGRAEVSTAQAAVDDLRARIARDEALGKNTKGQQGELIKAEASLAKSRNALEPYDRALQERE